MRTKMVDSAEVLIAEQLLLDALVDAAAKAVVDEAKKLWLDAMKAEGCTTSGRSNRLQITYYRSSGALQADAVARHFGCSMQFLRQFRRLGRATVGVRKCAPLKPKKVKSV